MRLRTLLLPALALVVTVCCARNERTTAAAPADVVSPFVNRHCIACHGPEKQKGGLALDKFPTARERLKARETWETVIERVKAKEMPPARAEQPTETEREAFLAALEGELSTGVKPGPGRVTVRRLNRAEYNNTIRDLFGMDLRPADDFPLDDVGYGFDNNGDVLSLSPLHLEKFMLAADRVLERVFAREAKVKPTQRLFDGWELSSIAKNAKMLPEGQGYVLTQSGDLLAKFKFEHPGEYLFKLRAFGDAVAGEAPKLQFKIDGRDEGTVDVEPKGQPKRKQEYEFTVRLPAGEHRFGVTLLNPNPKREAGEPERSVTVKAIEVNGPLNPPPPEPTEAYKRLMVARPGDGVSTAEAARRVLASFARRAYRRPATDAEIDGLVKLVALADSQGDSFDYGIRLALKAVLVSPHFLFRAEADRGAPGEAHPVSELELASRLSYFLWSSMPDDELLRLAQFGELRGQIEKQVRRMLRDPKARALADNFAGQWLQTRNLKTWPIDPKQFPGFDEPLRQAMIEETLRFFDAVVREDRPVTEFLSADYTFVNERLAKHYGIPDVKGPEFRRVSLNGTQRGGVLTQASVLTVTSNPTRTSPVKRGKFILENVLGATVPPPPPDVPELKDDEAHQLSGSLRQRLEQHRANPGCASCHERMDPPGLAFEQFDAIGAFRQTDGKFPVDASGTLPNGKSFRDAAEFRALLGEQSDAFRRCLAEKLLTFALGRGLERYDRAAVEEIGRTAKSGGDRFSALVLAIVNSEPFQKRTNAPGPR